LVTISFDPAHDTPEVLRAYAQAVGADPARWRFATGDPARLKHIIGGGFEVYYAPNDDGSYTFDPAFVLVDGWGIIRAEYHYRTLVPDTERMLRHIGVIAEEVRNSKGAARVAYEAAHLFLCYAQ
jgi:protein SCO1/2